ncbi:GntR family transcriptional regulator [Paraburkholderia sp. BL25I1N1]|uniref:GntR family transcriptional regulator n=1 Tax=Paraburkholderia sp. BL25I1N1 TaxID=1938804 RepID=UPI000D052DB1|nr:GntR family transcriptional regulator [Paraburkholderia sp. BL25I1N1]PRY04495.1 DNA-binding GntR family transcriptional regulator [Paraburkholderia sp. BL25I1N1]
MKTETNGALADQVAAKIIDIARTRSLRAGEHLREEALASELGLSRSPVRRGLALLVQHGIVTKEPNRGIFLAMDAHGIDIARLPFGVDPLEDFYLRVADDCLTGEIPEEFYEAGLLRKYDVPRGQLLKVLSRLANEGMISRKPGQGWRINPFLHDTDAHIQSYRFRMAIEPAALLEPTFRIDQAAFAKARAVQLDMLNGDIFKLSRPMLFKNGSEFHEMLVRCSGNRFFIEAIERQNQLRRFMEYKAATDRQRLVRQCKEHLELLDLIESGGREHAAAFMRRHLDVVSKIKAKAEAREEQDALQRTIPEAHF